MEVAKLFSNLKKIHLWNSWGFIFYVRHCYDYLSSVSSKLRDIYLRMDFHPGLQTHLTLWICRVWEIFGDMRRHQKTSRDMGRHEKHEETWKDKKNIRHEKTWEKWKDMKRNEKTWKDMKRHEKIKRDIKNMKRHRDMKTNEKTCVEMKRHEKTWGDKKRHEERWKDMKRHEKTWEENWDRGLVKSVVEVGLGVELEEGAGVEKWVVVG